MAMQEIIKSAQQSKNDSASVVDRRFMFRDEVFGGTIYDKNLSIIERKIIESRTENNNLSLKSAKETKVSNSGSEQKTKGVMADLEIKLFKIITRR